ncbi:MAG TPA: hypothetical protein VHP33_09950 [Polyangiaceae bacterium]|nr:hypothetical protein [Polyangiaceae bacterium]
MLLIAPALIWSCGGSSEKSSSPGAGGSAKAGTSSVAGMAGVGQSGSNLGGKSSSGGSGEAGSGRGGTGQPMGGAAIAAGAGGAAEVGGSSAGAGGANEPYDPELLGFECDSKRCAVGQACIRCVVGDTSSRLCVPSPSGDPAGFETALAGCDKPLSTVFNECDGPEDCPNSKYCIAAESANGFMRCRDEPSTATGSCCFACGAATDCTLCRSAADCPDNVACEPAQSAPAGIMGCARRR